MEEKAPPIPRGRQEKCLARAAIGEIERGRRFEGVKKTTEEGGDGSRDTGAAHDLDEEGEFGKKLMILVVL